MYEFNYISYEDPLVFYSSKEKLSIISYGKYSSAYGHKKDNIDSGLVSAEDRLFSSSEKGYRRRNLDRT